MSSPEKEETIQWLLKSQRDLDSARRLLDGEPPYLDTAVFHCQQAAEKALKAYLTHHGRAFPKTHDLTELLANAATLDRGLDAWQPIAQSLTPYAVEFRYPGDILEPTLDEANAAVHGASDLVAHVRALLRR